MDVYQGRKYKVVHCEGAKESFEEALGHVTASARNSRKAAMFVIIKRMADGKDLSRDSFPSEGNLPDGNRFKAFKKQPIRAYGWFSRKYDGVFFISHYIHKNVQKLQKNDIRKVCNNWRLKEQEQ